MEKKDQVPQMPHNPEKEAFEKHTRKDPNEINPQEVYPQPYSQQYDGGDAPDSRRQSPDVANDPGGEQSREGYPAAAREEQSAEQQDDEFTTADEEGAYGAEDVEENKSPLRPIDANRTPEEWANLQHNQPDVVEDKRDYDAVSM